MPNGVLTNYILSYSNTTDTVSVELEGTATNFTADNLNEATTYFFQLNASTIVGYGPAAVVNATTDEDGKTAVFFFVTETMYCMQLATFPDCMYHIHSQTPFQTTPTTQNEANQHM